MYGQSQSPTPASRRRLALIGGAVAIFLAAAGGTALIIARPRQVEETPSPIEEAAAGEPTASPGATLAIEPSTPTPVLPTPTLPPIEHTILPGQELYAVIALYYTNVEEILPAVLALNGLSDPNLIQEGQVLLIPAKTPTPAPTQDPNATPEVVEGEATGEAEVAEQPPVGATSPSVQGGDPEHRVDSPDGRFWVHTVREGETIASIARAYDSSVPCILQNNNFTYSDNQPVIFVGQQINICIVVTLTPTPSPTGDPFNSTATPTPTVNPPLLLAPANGATFARGDDVSVQWVATYPLTGDQHYLVIAQDLTNNRDFRDTTTDNAYKLPDDLRPGVGQSLMIEWRVVIVEGDTIESPMVSGLGEPRQFTWGG